MLRDLTLFTATAILALWFQRVRASKDRALDTANIKTNNDILLTEEEEEKPPSQSTIATTTTTTTTAIATNESTTAAAEEEEVNSNKTNTNTNDDTLIPRPALIDGTSLDNQELVQIVDEHNQPSTARVTRREMRLQNLWHRATYIIVRINNSTTGSQILVQQRSLFKDYCPGKLDPTPGGVVGYGESYHENAQRELQEEMGIDHQKAQLKRLFSFPYQDSRVRVWGDLYECHLFDDGDGAIQNLPLQETEVAQLLEMTFAELKNLIQSTPEDFMPDSLHAMKLYLQYFIDSHLDRRLLRGYSSDTEHYRVRPKVQAVFFDCDDCLYFDGWTVAKLLTRKIDQWCVDHGLEPGQAYQLYKQYGTALRGLLAEGYIEDTEQTKDSFLEQVHDLPIADLIPKDPSLRKLLLEMDPTIPKYIFTASVRHHAERCLKALGIDDLFVDIIDVKACNFETKHSPMAFARAMMIAGVNEPEACVFLDDSVKNIEAARRVGWRSVLVGRIARDNPGGDALSVEDAESEIDRIHDFRTVLPELFSN